jgi:hypothetical protein
MGRKIEVGEVLGEVFEIYRANAGILIPVAFWLFLIVAIVDGVLGTAVTLLPIVLAVSTIVGTIYQGIVVSLVRDVQDGRRDSSVGELFQQASPVIFPLIVAGLLAGIGIGVGMFLLIVPGLFLLTIWAVIAPAIVIERAGILESFRRSRELVRGSGWPVFGTIVVAYLITVIAGLILGGIAAAIADGAILRIVFSALASTLTAPILALVAGVLYYRLVGIERASAPPPAPPAGRPRRPGGPTRALAAFQLITPRISSAVSRGWSSWRQWPAPSSSIHSARGNHSWR